MPPITRTAKSTKSCKENIGISKKKLQLTEKITRTPRKVLGDKTNSSSDDNTSVELPNKIAKKPTNTKLNEVLVLHSTDNVARPQRDRRIPSRFAENQVPKNLSNSKENACRTNKVASKKNVASIVTKNNDAVSTVKYTSTTVSPLKSQKVAEISLVANRPRRTTQLPSRFEDYSVSPSKLVPVQPCLADKNSKIQTTNNYVKPSSPSKKSSKMYKKDLSYQLLQDKKENESNQDVYEFTFDPDEEPAPQKKKRKTVKKKPANPKVKKVIYKNYYEQNVNKALAALKNAVGKKPTPVNNNNNVVNSHQPSYVGAHKNIRKVCEQPSNEKFNGVENHTAPIVQRNVASKIIIGNTKQSNTSCNVQNIPQIQENILLNVSKEQTNVTNNAAPVAESSHSIRIEDIAADFESSPQYDIDYSPVNSPNRPQTPVTQINRISDVHNHDDPLNLMGNVSFHNPIANSSMNTSVSHPHASPWRIEFESLPIRWHVSSYVKPNMTPAVECSFVNFDDKNKKKHIYTNLVPECNEALPEITQKDQPNLVQSSIISFIREMVAKSSSKKHRGRSSSPVISSLFNDVSTKTPKKDDDKVKKTTRQLFTPQKNSDKTKSDSSNADSSKDTSTDKENSKDSSRGQKRKNNKHPHSTPAKTPRKEKNDKYFGFDDSENLENVSPNKDIGRKRSLRQARARAVLREINEQAGPARAVIPVAVKSAREVEVDRVYDEMKSASDAPEIPSKDVIVAAAVNVVEPIEEMNEDSQTSVHLFEDIDFAHHLKPSRRSYGKAKKVTFIRQVSSESQDSDLRPLKNGSDEEEDLNDLTFDPGMPLIEEERKRPKKKQTKKQKMTKKEMEEAEAWAAGFNSMCEDVEEFSLVVE